MSAPRVAPLTLFALACAPSPAPPPPAPAAPPPRFVPAAPPRAAPAPEPAPPVPERPSCLPPEHRSEGRVVAAERTADDRLAFCVRRGFASDAVTRCLVADPRTSTLRGHEELWPGIRPGDMTRADNPGSAVYASAAGTLTVCAGRGDCWERRFRPPAKDAWDEVYGAVPAFTLPGTRKVLVADVTEGNGPATLWLHAYDVGKRARVGQTLVTRGEYGIELQAFGSRVLLVACAREGASCHAFVVDPSSLKVSPLGVELDPALRGGVSEPAPASLRLEDGTWVVADARGTRLLLHDAQGKLARSVTLAHPGDLGLGPSRVVPVGGGRLAVIQGAPNAGTVEWVSLADGASSALVATECAPTPNAR